MAKKLFYSLEEAMQKLKMTEAQVNELVATSKLQEFRDRDRLMFKADQVDLLAGGGDEDIIPLADASGEQPAISLVSDSGTGINLENPKEQTGISIFEAENTDTSDPSAVTQVSQTAGPAELSLETAGSGSGLMDMTREADDSSLGADLLQDIYSGSDTAGGSGAGMEPAAAVGAEAGAGALFESTTPTDSDAAGVTPAMMMAMAEPYDGAGSGLVGGLALGIVLTLAAVCAIVIAGVLGVNEFTLTSLFAGNLWMYVGIFAGITLFTGVIGWVLGRR